MTIHESWISSQHQARYRAYYATYTGRLKPSPWIPAVRAVAWQYQATSILDYGCGPVEKLAFYADLPVRGYDPGIQDLAALPDSADVVICLHTLEHIEEEKLPGIMSHLASLAHRALFLVVSCQVSTKVLPDGLPWHSLVKPGEWWRDTFRTLPDFRLIWPYWLPQRQDRECVMLLERIRD